MKVKEIEIQNKWYPKQLRKINNPPKKLYVLGNHEILNTDSLSIIGSRCCTSYGADMAREFARKLAKKGITIVSGMAKGIDSNAHLGAIEANGKTIAVLGSGFNHIYPDKEIYEKILKSGGAVITEYSENVGVSPQGFRDRNRIVAGLSLGTLVIEAKQRSGTGITANYVKRYKRKLFCIPHKIEDKSGVGTNRLLKKGAILVTEVKDILQYFKTIDNEENTEKELEIEMSEEYRKIYEEIKRQTATAEEISKKVKMSISDVNTILTMLELEDYIQSLPGNHFQVKRC